MTDRDRTYPQRREERDANGVLLAEWWVMLDANNTEVHHGEYTAYHPNGQRREHGFWDQGKRVGPWYGWFSDGRRAYDKVHDSQEDEGSYALEHSYQDPERAIESKQPTSEGQSTSGLRVELIVVLALAWLPPMVIAAVTPALLVAPEEQGVPATHATPLSVQDERALDFAYVTWELPAIAASIQIIAPVLLLLWMRRKQISWREYGLVRPNLFRDGIWTIIALALGTGLPLLLSQILPTSAYDHGIAYYPLRTAGYTTMVVSLVLNSIAEELVWRGYMIPRLTRLTGSALLSIWVSTVLFASYHIYQGPMAVLSIFFTGLVYALLFHRIRRLWPFVLSHTVHNMLIYLRAYEAVGMTPGQPGVG